MRSDISRFLSAISLIVAISGFLSADEAGPEWAEFTFSRLRDLPKGEKLLGPSAKSPDGRVRLSIHRDTALLEDVATGKAFGKRLGIRLDEFTCYSFSPDGKYVATGSRHDDEKDYEDGPVHIGEIDLWNAATGTQVFLRESKESKVGSAGYLCGPVKSVRFSADGHTIYFEDEQRVMGGK